MKRLLQLLLLACGFFICFSQGLHADILDNWTTIQITTNDALDCVVYGNGVYVMAATDYDFGEIFSSNDGLHWTSRYYAGGSWGLVMHYAGGRFVGVSDYGFVATSPDGTNWTILPAPWNYFSSSGYASGDITYGNGLYVEVGDTNGTGGIITSPDGTNWTFRISAPSGKHISSVIYSGSKFVAIGSGDGYEYTSTTGTTWTRRSIPGGSQIYYANGLYIVPITSSANLLSADGINWSQQNTGLTNTLNGIIFANGLFMANAGYYLATSTDGKNWFQYPKFLPGIYPYPPYSYLATDGSRLVNFQNVQYVREGNIRYYGNVLLSDPLVSVRMSNNPPSKIVLSGLVGRNYQIQSSDALGAGSNWRTNATMQLTNTPFVWTDSTATNSARFYRGVLLP